MHKLSFDTDRGTVVIELFDNAFVNMWAQHAAKMIKKYQYAPRTAGWPFLHNHKNDADEIINRLLTIIDDINHQDFLVPMPEIVKFQDLQSLDISAQKVLNKLHRYCVTATNLRDRWTLDRAAWTWVDYENIKFDYLINLLNQTIHQLEEYVVTPRKKRLLGATMATEFAICASKHGDVDIYQDDVDYSIPDNMQQYLSIESADVWIKKDILGKDYLTGFIDHDDVTESDIQPPAMFSGAFMIDLTGRQSLYQDQEFLLWLNQPLRSHHGNYALGNIQFGQEHIMFCRSVDNIKIS